MAIDLWKELLPNILQGKEPLVFEDINKEYSPWVINQCLSYYMDTILLANEMNKSYNLDKKMQYDFLFYGLKKKKRKYVPWIKLAKNDDLSLIKQVYNYSNKKAKEVLGLITEDELVLLRKKYDKGGKGK